MINEVPNTQKRIAITFDDGPNPIFTPKILDIFAKVEGKATFFMIGEQIDNYPDIAREVVRQGHEIGNHTYSHVNLTELSPLECLNEVKRNENLIQKFTGTKPLVFRPPFLAYDEKTISMLRERSYQMIGALNTDALDWEQPGVDFILSKSRNHVKNGSILIFHDGYGYRSQTIEAVSVLVPELKSQGYELVTVSELLKAIHL